LELVAGGTLFLDEIDALSPALQAKLLRVLHEQRFERVGGTETLTTDARIVAATSLDLERLMAEGRFRRDLYHRLNVYPITLPPLRERPEDLRALTLHAFRLPPGGIELRELEKDLIRQALEQAHQNKSQAAKLLGLSRTQLRARMRLYGLE
jgi:transcriptional regulator with PAS, ATPase and Fis domain